MKEMLLLGAGASKEAGVPAAYEMTERIGEIFRSSPLHQTLKSLYGDFVPRPIVESGLAVDPA
jgi:hypothetical protein